MENAILDTPRGIFTLWFIFVTMIHSGWSTAKTKVQTSKEGRLQHTPTQGNATDLLHILKHSGLTHARTFIGEEEEDAGSVFYHKCEVQS